MSQTGDNSCSRTGCRVQRQYGRYCPRCQLEYQAGCARCSECGFEFSSHDFVEPAPPEVEMVIVFEGDSDTAGAAQAAVESVGIESLIANRSRRGAPVRRGSSQVLVRRDDEEAAREILANADE